MSIIGNVDLTREILSFLKVYNTSKGKVKKIKKDALEKLDKFINILIKIMVVNCGDMLISLKLLTLSNDIFYTVYDITINGDQQWVTRFTKEEYHRFQNIIAKEQINRSKLTFDDKKVLNTGLFDAKAKSLIFKVLDYWGVAKPRKVNADLLIEFILVMIFEASGDCDIITNDVLESISERDEFVKLDTCLGSYNVLATDKIEIDYCGDEDGDSGGGGSESV